LWKRRHTSDEVRVFEQNPPDATWGFGVVFSDRALEFLREDDPETVDLILPRMETWRDMTIVHRSQSVRIDGVGFSAIGRLELLQILQQRARAAGADLQFNTTVNSLEMLTKFDLIIAADGVNSIVRRAHENAFGTTISQLGNRFIWYGTTKPFDTLTQTFVACELGAFNAHHYRYAPTMSTFLVECDSDTWARSGFDTMDETTTLRTCEQIFATALQGHRLVSNRSFWRSFPWIWNEHWFISNLVLLGDALHTAHYSIGSGTRLALEDAVALVKALEAEPADLSAALSLFETRRKPIVKMLVAASRASALWYEQYSEQMRFQPHELAMAYISRTGRVDQDRLRTMSPDFMAYYDSCK
jgi:2-polyprenyl-6-methoxyphenol hydroxylase-like FAD-dependent oxidoreductase